MKFLINTILILLVVSTICICAIKPKMHKAVIVYNSDYKLVQEDIVQAEAKEIPVMEITVIPEIKTSKKSVETVSEPKTKSFVNTTDKLQKHQTTLQPESKVTKIQAQKEPAKEVTKQEHRTSQNTVSSNNQVLTKTLTQKEEEIAWNVWRSNLQNQIMHDVRLPVLPNGIVFRFSFNVDKYGKITNIYTNSDNPAFTPYAIQYIAPVIRSYQGKSILNFPEGSTRTSTEFKGGWKISSNERLSTPQDYNDYEKVTRTVK